jgi:hypothetical protein
MNWSQQKQLCEALLQCQCMSFPNSRDTIVHLLPYRDHIRRGETGYEHVLNIVTESLAYHDGLQRLVEVVRSFEGPTRAMQEIDRILEQVFLRLTITSTIDRLVPTTPELPDPNIFPKGFLLKEQYLI